MENRIVRLLVAWLVAAGSPICMADPIEVSDGKSVEAIVSNREPTRIRVDRTKITNVVGNIYSSTNCAPKASDAAAAASTQQETNPAGDFWLTCDLAKGEIFVTPVSAVAGAAAKPINMFVSTEKATYSLRLRRADVPGGTIVLSDKSVSRQAAGGAGATAAIAGGAANYVRSLKAMLVAMVAERVPNDIRVDELNVPKQLWAESSFMLNKLFEGRGLVGEKYVLKNTSAAPLVLAEQEFDREGGEVLAVSIDNLNLRPDESTFVYVIRSGER